MTVANITIVEYEPKYADSIADMWNASNESWGGGTYVRTGEDIVREEKQNAHKHVFLALDNEEVVGYCSFNYYQEDEGALYIALLNVRPDYHGRKVGKSLVLRSVQATIDSGWPRVDLYTWAGNTKAVPTYKKCGFFWEKRDETTHLMNFIPTVLQTEAVRDYFNTADWYEDGKRDLSVKPDGEHENGFDYFTYHWEHEGQMLKIDFERTGRGIRLIENDDYLIKADIQQHSLPYGTSYPVTYSITNKSGKPLNVSLEGISNDHIQFELNESVEVQDSAIIEGQFFIHPIKQEINKWRTHPLVEATLHINGQKASFKTGVLPVFPIKLSMNSGQREFFKDEKAAMYLTLENQYYEDIQLTFTLPSTEVFSFEDKVYELTIPSKERQSISVQGLVKNYGLYTTNVQMTVKLKNEQVTVDSELTTLVQGRSGLFHGENSHEWVIGNANCIVGLHKDSNTIAIRDISEESILIHLPLARVGPPFSNEFKKNPPFDVVFHHKSNSIVMEAHYKLDGYDKLHLICYIEILQNGIATRHYRIHNLSDQPIQDELILKEKFYFQIENSVLPYKDRFLDLRVAPYAQDRSYWQTELMTENWMFTYTEGSNQGISWPQNCKLIKDGYYHAIDQGIGKLEAGGYIETAPFIFSMGTFREWDKFRQFVRKTHEHPSPQLSESMEYSINNGNPFVTNTINVKLREYKKISQTGSVTVSSKLGTVSPTEHSIQLENNPSESEFSIALQRANKEALVDIVESELDFETFILQKQSIIFPVGKNEITQQKTLQHGKEVLTVDNGVLRISASTDFAPSLFSLRYKEQEWLDSSFPEPTPKAWWNPWFGGVTTHPSQISLLSLLEESRSVAFAQLHDNKGNLWSGIKVTVRIEKNEVYKGLLYHQYFLLMPGVPVLATTIKVEQQANCSFQPLSLKTWNFYSAGDELSNSRVRLINTNGEEVQYKVGKADMDAPFADIAHYSSTERKQKLTFVGKVDNGDNYCYMDNQVVSTIVNHAYPAPHGAEFMTNPQFYVMSELDGPNSAYTDLLNIFFTLS